MKANALALSLILILVPFAGCSGTDTEVTVDMDSEDLQAIIDDNRDDFLNNTTVVVFQEYHNNTTVVNQYSNNSTSNVDQSGTSSSTTTYNYNGSASDSEIFVVRLDWDYSEYTGEITAQRDRNFTVEYSYYDYATNDDRTDSFTLPCWNYYDATDPNTNQSVTNNYWQNSNYFYDWWDYLYNNTIRDLLGDVAYYGSVESTCKEDSGNLIIDSAGYYSYNEQTGNDDWDYSQAPVFFEMSLPNGTMMKVVQIRTTHEYTDSSGNPRHIGFSWTVNEEHLTGSNPQPRYSDYCPIVYWVHHHVTDDTYYQDCGEWFGGWQDFDLRFNLVSGVFTDSVFSFTMYYELEPVSSHS